jgi:hypothetical protein
MFLPDKKIITQLKEEVVAASKFKKSVQANGIFRAVGGVDCASEERIRNEILVFLDKIECLYKFSDEHCLDETAAQETIRLLYRDHVDPILSDFHKLQDSIHPFNPEFLHFSPLVEWMTQLLEALPSRQNFVLPAISFLNAVPRQYRPVEGDLRSHCVAMQDLHTSGLKTKCNEFYKHYEQCHAIYCSLLAIHLNLNNVTQYNFMHDLSTFMSAASEYLPRYQVSSVLRESYREYREKAEKIQVSIKASRAQPSCVMITEEQFPTVLKQPIDELMHNVRLASNRCNTALLHKLQEKDLKILERPARLFVRLCHEVDRTCSGWWSSQSGKQCFFEISEYLTNIESFLATCPVSDDDVDIERNKEIIDKLFDLFRTCPIRRQGKNFPPIEDVKQWNVDEVNHFLRASETSDIMEQFNKAQRRALQDHASTFLQLLLLTEAYTDMTENFKELRVSLKAEAWSDAEWKNFIYPAHGLYAWLIGEPIVHDKNAMNRFERASLHQKYQLIKATFSERIIEEFNECKRLLAIESGVQGAVQPMVLAASSEESLLSVFEPSISIVLDEDRKQCSLVMVSGNDHVKPAHIRLSLTFNALAVHLLSFGEVVGVTPDFRTLLLNKMHRHYVKNGEPLLKSWWPHVVDNSLSDVKTCAVTVNDIGDVLALKMELEGELALLKCGGKSFFFLKNIGEEVQRKQQKIDALGYLAKHEFTSTTKVEVSKRYPEAFKGTISKRVEQLVDKKIQMALGNQADQLACARALMLPPPSHLSIK